MRDYIAIATWPFGETAVRAAAPLLERGASALDAVVAGAQAVEDDPKVNSVGYGGLPNSIGIVQLDASVMDGKTLNCGAVAGLEDVRHATALARRVMDKTAHVLLVGEGARTFAVQQGFPLESLITPEALTEWRDRGARAAAESPAVIPSLADLPLGHDTVSVLACDHEGSLAGATTTSGLAHKLPGRVGDSPIIGAGLYVDNTAGAAGGTGIGEEIIRVGGALRIVDAMRAGRSAQEACEMAIRLVNQLAARRRLPPAQVAFIAIDTRGSPGAACTAVTNFRYAIARPGQVQVLKPTSVSAD
jgi:isoaspartyl peptidase/L-asparaginase-like protein (Ntn-hydrolase superfamily)